MTLSRGQLQDLLNMFAIENPRYREKLIALNAKCEVTGGVNASFVMITL